MKICHLVRTRTFHAIAALTLMFGHLPAGAAGFQLNESSASGLGTAFAGGAAAAEDAATLWSNAAGIAHLRDRQAVGVLHLITPSIKLRDIASKAASGQALGGTGGDAGGLNVVPNLYLAAPMGAGWSVGLGVSAPFGLVTEYDDGWSGRFQALKSSIKTINLNPTVAWKPGPALALGLGLNLQRMAAVFTNRVNYSGALLSAAVQGGILPGSATFNAIAQATPGLEAHAHIEGSDTAVGWNVGLLWELDRDARVGLHYRSSMKYRIDGQARFSRPTPVVPASLAAVVGALAGAVDGAALADTGVSAEVELPAIVNVSYFTALDKRWDLMADAQWTGWSSIQNLSFVRDNGSVLQSTPENFRDAWKFALGARYRVDDHWLLRGGVAIDRSPVQDAYRTARLPDADRTWLAAGAQWRMGPTLLVDLGAAYLRVKKATIFESGHPPGVAAYGLIDGQYGSHTVIVSAQAGWAF